MRKKLELSEEIEMKTVLASVVCALIFLTGVGSASDGIVGIMPIPDNWTSTTTPIIIAMPLPTITVPITTPTIIITVPSTTTTTTSTTTTTATLPPTALPDIIIPTVPPIQPPQTIQPILPPTRIQYAGNLTLGSQIYSVNIQNVSVPQALIVSINGTFPVKLYQNVSRPLNLRVRNLSIWAADSTVKVVGIARPAVSVDFIEKDGVRILNVTLNVNKTARQLTIKKFMEGLTLESGGIVATTEITLEINESGVYVGKTELKVLPDGAYGIAEDVGMSAIENIELKEVDQKPVYELKGKKKGKLFAVIPVDMKVELHVDANTGEVVRKKEPWWSFLVKG